MYDFDIFSVGRLSPFPSLITEGCAASLVADAVVPVLLITMPKPTPGERRLVETGDLGVALDRQGCSAIVLWRFSSPGVYPITLDTPLHVGIEDVRKFPNFSIRGLSAGEERAASVILQDEAGIVQVIRLIVFPRPILVGLEPLIARQIAERRKPRLAERHWRRIAAYYARRPNLAMAYDLAPIKAKSAWA